MQRRTWLTLAAGGLLGATAAGVVAQAGPRRIAIKAVKFEFVPGEVTVQQGKPVTLVLSTPDFPHGFALPDFNVRRDLIPGKDVELTFTPDKAGKFHMLCDNFCGDGHDKMSGWLIVREQLSL